jgi:glycine/D-amino acid oxidase-like deaminating enzyme
MEQPTVPRPPLLADVPADVIVIGAGIVGALVAHELVGRGYGVAVLERATVAHGTSGNSTAKVTALHGNDWSRIVAHHPVDDALRDWAALNEAAPGEFGRIVTGDGVSCGFRYADAYLCAPQAGSTKSLERQHAALTALGVRVREMEQVEFSPLGAVKAFSLGRQAMIDPYAFCTGVMNAAVHEGCTLYENSAVRSLEPTRTGWIARTDAGTVNAPVVVMASLAPARDPLLLFTRLFPYAHYAIESIPTSRTDGMWIEAGGEYLTARPVSEAEGHWIFSGSSARLASTPDVHTPLQQLTASVMEATGAGEPFHFWMAEDYSTPDGLPFAGRVGPRDGLYYIGGFGGWGMTKSQVCASLVADMIQGHDRPALASLLSPSRLPQRSTWHYLLSENVTTLRHLFVPAPSQKHLTEPVEALGLAAGDTPPRCTHLGCLPQVNGVDQTLDCPCHGSRFAADGEPIYGPARRTLRVRPEKARGRLAEPLRLAAMVALGVAVTAAAVYAIARACGCRPARRRSRCCG